MYRNLCEAISDMTALLLVEDGKEVAEKYFS
jgi:hypothetical protein